MNWSVLISCLRDGMSSQQGGIAILTALGFLLFSVPLITASLDLAQTTAIDARVKTDITLNSIEEDLPNGLFLRLRRPRRPVNPAGSSGCGHRSRRF